MAYRTDLLHVLLENAQAAFVTVDLTETLKDLRGAVGIPFQPSTDQRFERVEFAAALRATARTVGIGTGIFGGRFRVDCQLACDLREIQAFTVVEADFTVSVVVDHGCEVIRRRISAIGSASLVRGDAGGNGIGLTPC